MDTTETEVRIMDVLINDILHNEGKGLEREDIIDKLLETRPVEGMQGWFREEVQDALTNLQLEDQIERTIFGRYQPTPKAWRAYIHALEA